VFELYNAHLSAKPAPGSRFIARLSAFGSGTTVFTPTLPSDSVFKLKIEGRGLVQARTDKYGHLIGLFGFNMSNLGEGLELYLVDESELNSD